ncbi:MAG: hypothetical protein IRZ16_24045 [Myxococcaceae bacterium]|nr:hypothetical protein [Myxococcaceae bacterium]
MDKPNHLATWSVSFAAASLGVWSTWAGYLWAGLRFRLPNWFLLHERHFFTAELAVLMIGTALTLYESGLLNPGSEDANTTRT